MFATFLGSCLQTAYLGVHLRHTGEKHLKCDVCDEAVDERKQLTVHVQTLNKLLLLMRFLNVFSIVILFSGSEADRLNCHSDEPPINGNDGFETEDPIGRLTTTTRGMDRKNVDVQPWSILNATLKANGKYSTNMDVDEDLIAACEVFSILTNSTDESFADNFFKIGTDKLISALKGVWIVASFASGHSKVKDARTANIIRNITQGLEKLCNKVECKPDIIFLATDSYGITQTFSDIGIDLREYEKMLPDMKVKINEISFNTKVVVPVNSTSWSMIAYINENTAENKAQFLKYYKAQNYYRLGNYIDLEAFDYVRNVIDASGFDSTKVDQMRSKCIRYLFQMHIFEYFNGGLKGEEDIEIQPSFGRVFSTYIEDIRVKLKRASKYYNENFLPVYVKENMLKSVLDASGGNNCDLAQNILDQLKSKYARHKYAVIVSDGVSKPDQFAYYGYANKMVMEEEYNGKSVIAFMASTRNKKKKEAFYSQNHLGIIALDVTNKYSANNLHTLMDFGNNTDGYQTAVYKDRYNPCLRSDMNVSDTLHFEVPSLKWGIWPSSETLSYFIVF